ncbi:hypothetical protein H8U31_001290 [Salmonella enterica]|nr:hypothetical protein [Salmonella enterica]EGC0267539.1 hypothetical protein [Salmonella enterica]
MKKPAIKKTLPAPPSLDETNLAPTAIDRKNTDHRGKGDQFNFQCSPELKRQIKLYCVELGITHTEYLEKMHNFYYAAHKGSKV